MHRSTREFVSALERAGELVRVRAPVSPVLEIAEIADRVSKARAANPPSAGPRRTDPRFFDRGGHALLFENVEGSKTPVLINAFGSYHRMEMALGAQRFGGDGLESLAARIGALVKPEPPQSPREAMAKARQFAPLLKIGPRRRRTGWSQDVVVRDEAIDLTTLPIIRCWPHDGDSAALGYPAGVNAGIAGLGHGAAWDAAHRGRYITLAGIHTIHADDADVPRPRSHNIGMYRVQLLGPRRVAMHWHMHHDGASHWRSWKKRGEPMPVAIALGGEGVLPYAATAPLPPGISELLMAGFLNGRGIEMVRAKSVPLWVPANADIVIEGWVSHEAGFIGWDPRVSDEPLGPGAVFEGPFGDHTGFYSMPDRYPIVDVSAVTMRRGAIYPTTIVGLPPQEDYFLGKATERLFLPLLRTLIHDIEDYDLPMFGAFHNCAMLKIGKAYPLQARRVMHAVWGAGQMAWTKCVFVVDESVDVHDAFAVLRAASVRCDPRRDVERARGPLDILDHAAPRLGAGGKIGFDCTARHEDERVGRYAIADEQAMAHAIGAMDRHAIEQEARGVHGVLEARLPAELGAWLLVRVESPISGERARAIAHDVARRMPRLRSIEPASADGDRPLVPFVILLGSGVALDDLDRALFHWLANCDPARDGIDAGSSLVFDATPKPTDDLTRTEPVRAWPPIIEMDAAMREKVDRRWSEYGIPLG
ncbi:MAG: UbiD family decarboxylase [Phycisphaerales bacterium]|jgi:4-hydroxy-3-polyprenylbenzoate decarboxylase|nr:UbiD family decarboxylase [Phycisphaerales bacterium]